MESQKLKIHFIGIGGIGTSALAFYFLAKNHKVTGSDLTPSEITKALQKRGAKIYIGHKEKNLPKNVDMVIYSPAIPFSNPELKKAKKICKKVLSYPQALGELTKKHFTIAISGTHGKSTTSAMIGLILKKAKLDPTVILGTKVKEFHNLNCVVGKSKFLVIEADEHFGSFLNYWPKIIVITNIERDHLDYYKNLKNIFKGFKTFVSHLPKDGVLILPTHLKKHFSNILNLKCFSLFQKEAKKIKKILKVPGKHNVLNALAALKVARTLQIPDDISFEALSNFKGTWRRFEIISTKPLIISDYAHHPTEIKATLESAKEKYPKRKIWVVYQPHQYQRTFFLFKDFVKVFKTSPADKIILTDIFDVPGREKKELKKKVNSEKLAKAVNNPKKVIYIPQKDLLEFLFRSFPKNELLIIMGAGDIYKLPEAFLKKINTDSNQ